MAGGKVRKTIHKVLEVRRWEENEAALEVAGRSAESKKAEDALAAAEEQLEATAARARAASSTLRRRIEKGAKGTELAMAQAHMESVGADLERARNRVAETKAALVRAHRALKGARERLRQTSARRRVAEKYAGRLAERDRGEKEKREEHEH